MLAISHFVPNGQTRFSAVIVTHPVLSENNKERRMTKVGTYCIRN